MALDDFSPYRAFQNPNNMDPYELEVYKRAMENQNPLALLDSLRGGAVATRDIITGKTPFEFEPVAQAYMKGFSGQMPSEGFLKDVAIDPLTYTGIGGIYRGFKALPSLIKNLSTNENVLKQSASVARKIPGYIKEQIRELPRDKEAIISAINKFYGGSKDVAKRVGQMIMDMPANQIEELYNMSGMSMIKPRYKKETGNVMTKAVEEIGSFLEEMPYKSIDADIFVDVAKRGESLVAYRPFSDLAKKYKFSGNPAKIYGQVRNKIEELVRVNESLFTSDIANTGRGISLPSGGIMKQAKTGDIMFRDEIFSDKSIKKATDFLDSKIQLSPNSAQGQEAKIVKEHLEKIITDMPETMSLKEAKEYLSMMSQEVKNFGIGTSGKSSQILDRAIKTIAGDAQDNLAIGIERKFGKRAAEQYLERNKELRVLIESVDPILARTKSNIKKGPVTETDATLFGLLGGRFMEGGPVLPILGAVTGKLTSKALQGTPAFGRFVTSTADVPGTLTQRAVATMSSNKEENNNIDPIAEYMKSKQTTHQTQENQNYESAEDIIKRIKGK